MTHVKQRTTISHSEVETFIMCPRKHFYQYGMELEQDVSNDGAQRGTILHSVMEVFFRAMKAKVPFEEAQAATFAELVKHNKFYPKFVGELSLPIQLFFKEYPFVGWEVLEIEGGGVLKISDDIQMPYRIDLLIRDLYGDIWVLDVKSVYDFYSVDEIDLSPQLPKYLVALRVNGQPVDKVGYLQFRYRSQQDVTTANKYVRFTPFDLTNVRLQRVMEEHAYTSQQILEVKKQDLATWSKTAIRTANKSTCTRMCRMRALCIAELNDRQPNLVMQTDYKKRERAEWDNAERPG